MVGVIVFSVPRGGRGGLQASPDAIMAALNVSTSRAVQKKLREVAKHHGGEVHWMKQIDWKKGVCFVWFFSGRNQRWMNLDSGRGGIDMNNMMYICLYYIVICILYMYMYTLLTKYYLVIFVGLKIWHSAGGLRWEWQPDSLHVPNHPAHNLLIWFDLLVEGICMLLRALDSCVFLVALLNVLPTNGWSL